MPNRIIKETIRSSKSVNQLSDFQFRLWIYLITYVDDYGRGSADPELLKGFVFPRRKGVTESQISAGLTALANAGMIEIYEVDGEPFLYFPTWSQHQRIQQKRSKFPEPNDGSRKFTVGHGDSPPESNPNPNNNISAEQSSAPPVIELPLNDGTMYPISQEQCQEWAGLYPAVDVIQQLRQMKGWLDSNPKKRKTKRGIKAFCTRWLGKEQDKGAYRPEQQAKGRTITLANGETMKVYD